MNAFCRSCSRSDEFQAIPLGAISESSEVSISLMLAYCTQLEIYEGDKLPQQICYECLTSLDTMFSFKRLCRQNEVQFQRMLKQQSLQRDPEPEFFHCCFQPCTVTSTSIEDLERHAKKQHRSERLRNLRRRRSRNTDMCTVCMAGFYIKMEWRQHIGLLRGTQPRHSCGKCSKVFPLVNRLAIHQIDECAEPSLASANLDESSVIQRLEEKIEQVLKASSGKEHVIPITQQEKEVILTDKVGKLGRFSEQLFKISEMCQNCNYEATMETMKKHLEYGNCTESYSILSILEMQHSNVTIQCQSCRYTTNTLIKMQRHQAKRDHTGMKNLVLLPTCEDCGYQSYSNLRRHQITWGHSGVKQEIMKDLLRNENPPEEETPNEPADPHCSNFEEGSGTVDHYGGEDRKSNPFENEEDLQPTSSSIIEQVEDKIKEFLATSLAAEARIRITQQEKGAILTCQKETLQRFNLLVGLNQKINLFEVCETCRYEATVGTMQKHLSINRCKGVYSILRISEVHPTGTTIQCLECGYRTKFVANMSRHQTALQHSGKKTFTMPAQLKNESKGYRTFHGKRKNQVRRKYAAIRRQNEPNEVEPIHEEQHSYNEAVQNVGLETVCPDSGILASNPEEDTQTDGYEVVVKKEYDESFQPVQMNESIELEPPIKRTKLPEVELGARGVCRFTHI